MKKLLIAAVVAIAGCANAGPLPSFTTYTVDYVRSPNLEQGCNTHQGPGCEPKYPFVTEDRYACFANETYTGEFCALPVITYWRTADDLILGCSNRYAPGCEIPNSPPLTQEGCYFNERLVALVPGRPALGAKCMVRVSLVVTSATRAAAEQQ